MTIGISSTVQYAKGGNGWVAYRVVGNGVPVALLPSMFSHLDLMWDNPLYSSFVQNLAAVSRLIIFDRSGVGLSDPMAEGVRILEQTADDFCTVMDANHIERAAIFGVASGGCLAAFFAATEPNRVSDLILYSAFAKAPMSTPISMADPDLEGQPPESWYPRANANPTPLDDKRVDEWNERFYRSVASPGVMRNAYRMIGQVDVSTLLDRITARTLVMARKRDPIIAVENSHYLAKRIPNAQLVELDGIDHDPWFGDTRAVLDTIQRFLVGTNSMRQSRNVRGTPLSPREREILELVATGLKAREIAQRLFISTRTVERHVSNAYGKLGINSRVEVARWVTIRETPPLGQVG